MIRVKTFNSQRHGDAEIQDWLESLVALRTEQTRRVAKLTSVSLGTTKEDGFRQTTVVAVVE